MSDATDGDLKREYKVDKGPWLNAWKIAAGVGALGLLGAGAGYAADAKHFAYSWLFAFMFVLTIALGSIFFVIIQHLTSAHWSVTSRRTAEFFLSGFPVLAVLFLGVAVSVKTLYPWTHMDEHGAQHHEAPAASHEGSEHGHEAAAHAEHGSEHAAPHGRPSYEELEEEEEQHILHKKAAYLNTTGFFVRALLYFGVWIFLGMRFFGWSTAQDKDKSKEHSKKAQGFAPIGAILFGLSLTFAGFDWVMSLDPIWYSTIFGVWIFAGSVVAIFASLILVTLSLKANGYLGDAVNTEHYHDLGKLLFGFNVFWAYIGFSQFFLIWYASIPEETRFYHRRWGEGEWINVSIAILVFHFVVPFLFLISRNIKRRIQLLRIGAALLLFMHMVEWYWIVMPNLNPDKVPFHWMDIACVLGIGGSYLALVFRNMTKHHIIPVGDPRLPRSLHFENV